MGHRHSGRASTRGRDPGARRPAITQDPTWPPLWDLGNTPHWALWGNTKKATILPSRGLYPGGTPPCPVAEPGTGLPSDAPQPDPHLSQSNFSKTQIRSHPAHPACQRFPSALQTSSQCSTTRGTWVLLPLHLTPTAHPMPPSSPTERTPSPPSGPFLPAHSLACGSLLPPPRPGSEAEALLSTFTEPPSLLSQH